MQTGHQMKIRLPTDLKNFLAAEAEKNGSSQNSEVIRALREKLQRETKTASESAATLAKA